MEPDDAFVRRINGLEVRSRRLTWLCAGLTLFSVLVAISWFYGLARNAGWGRHGTGYVMTPEGRIVNLGHVERDAERLAAGKIVEAEEFVLRDDKGNRRARLGFFSHPVDVHLDYTHVQFEMNDAQGNPRIMLEIPDTSIPSIDLSDANGKPRISLGVWKEGSKISLLDEKSYARMSMAYNFKGEPCLGLMDEKHNLRALLGAIPEQKDEKGNRVVEARPISSLVLFDEHRDRIFEMPKRDAEK
jgi:hypothetical protein